MRESPNEYKHRIAWENKLRTAQTTQRVIQLGFNEAIAFLRAGEIAKAYEKAKFCLSEYESFESKGLLLDSEQAASLYHLVAQLAEDTGDCHEALSHAKRAMEMKPTPGRKVLIIVITWNLQMREEAVKMIQEVLSNNDSDNVMTRQLLLQCGLLRKSADP